MSNDQILQTIGQNGKPLPDGFVEADAFNQLHPKVSGVFEFWCDPNKAKALNLQLKDEVEIKTDGDTPFVHTIRCTRSVFGAKDGNCVCLFVAILFSNFFLLIFLKKKKVVN